jgi:G-patch domain
MAEEDDEYFIPLDDQRVFGAGIKRKRIAFIPSTNLESVAQTHTQAPATTSHDRYLSIIQKKWGGSPEDTDAKASNKTQDGNRNPPLCPICNLPLSAPYPVAASGTGSAKSFHDSSIAHQVCVTHSHPPSHIDREHVGLKYLSSYGWDPDNRQGLGAKGEGIRAPIKAKIKSDTVGLGIDIREGRTVQKQKPPLIRLNAKQIRQQEAEGKKREARLREAFYGKDLEKYLGPS